MHPKIGLSQEQMSNFCRRHRIVRLSLFGSILRDEFGAESDVDFLVEFDPRNQPGLFEIAEMESELSELIGRKADLRTRADLSRYFRDEVVGEAELQYAS